jgi:hypothetical protein
LSVHNGESFAQLELEFTEEELTSYVTWRAVGLGRKTINWLKKAAFIYWSSTNGIISKNNCDALREFILTKYRCDDAKSKTLNFAKGFLKYSLKRG